MVSTTSLEKLTLRGWHKATPDSKFRVAFPAEFNEQISRIFHNADYILRGKPLSINHVVNDAENRKYDGIKLEPISNRDYHRKVVEMNNKPEEDEGKIDFFSPFYFELDAKDRIYITSSIANALNLKKGDTYYFLGRGNYCVLVRIPESEFLKIMMETQDHITL